MEFQLQSKDDNVCMPIHAWVLRYNCDIQDKTA